MRRTGAMEGRKGVPAAQRIAGPTSPGLRTSCRRGCPNCATRRHERVSNGERKGAAVCAHAASVAHPSVRQASCCSCDRSRHFSSAPFFDCAVCARSLTLSCLRFSSRSSRCCFSTSASASNARRFNPFLSRSNLEIFCFRLPVSTSRSLQDWRVFSLSSSCLRRTRSFSARQVPTFFVTYGVPRPARPAA